MTKRLCIGGPNDREIIDSDARWVAIPRPRDPQEGKWAPGSPFRAARYDESVATVEWLRFYGYGSLIAETDIAYDNQTVPIFQYAGITECLF